MSSVNVSKLRSALERHAELSEKKLHKRHPHVAEWFNARGITPGNIRHQITRFASAGAIAGTMLLANPTITKKPAINRFTHSSVPKYQDIISENLKSLLPKSPRPLTNDEEQSIETFIKAAFGIHAKATLDGEHLNTTYGFIGAEQHLPRFPGDTANLHDAYQQNGITPGRGAWGYFANSRESMTEDLVQKEKWYVAVQTMYLPDWNNRLHYLREWYKYRKVIVINPMNGKAVIADIADAGPGKATGKSFGGSPEVMAHLESKDGGQKGPVVLFFVDDPENRIPLGPVLQKDTQQNIKETEI